MRVVIDNDGKVTAHAENSYDIRRLLSLNVQAEEPVKVRKYTKKKVRKYQKSGGGKAACPKCGKKFHRVNAHIVRSHKEGIVAPTGFPMEGAYEKGDLIT